MLGFPASTEFGKRIPKQKFYENLDVSPALHRMFVDQIKLVYWRNKLAASTLNIAAGESVTEIEVFEVRLNDPQLDEAVLKQIDKEIPYHTVQADRGTQCDEPHSRQRYRYRCRDISEDARHELSGSRADTRTDFIPGGPTEGKSTLSEHGSRAVPP